MDTAMTFDFRNLTVLFHGTVNADLHKYHLIAISLHFDLQVPIMHGFSCVNGSWHAIKCSF